MLALQRRFTCVVDSDAWGSSSNLRPLADAAASAGFLALLYSALACSIKLCLCSYSRFAVATLFDEVILRWW